ncbi:MAG: K+/H+ antiporter subunit F [Rhodocyclaceae bacterium]|jgi:multicomponent K+:H+ antiporter subunit F|nr:K+/H+ antiporter subunit F [Rhodocyclaceae bacterium]MCL4758895.1 K+/H+ antiporter subunit F [Rhodocyclaceae bacterium]
MIANALLFGYFAVSVALLFNLWRLFAGPSVMDRVLAVDTMVINVIALIILYGIDRHTSVYFEAALLLAMFGFISTVAFCRFVLRGDIIE